MNKPIFDKLDTIVIMNLARIAIAKIKSKRFNDDVSRMNLKHVQQVYHKAKKSVDE